MWSLTLILVAVSSATRTSAAPLDDRSGLEFSVQRTLAQNVVFPVEEVLRVYKKYNITAPAHVVVAANAKSAQEASVDARIARNGSIYTVPVVIGGHKFRLVPDTGSSDLWVWSKFLPTAQQAGHHIYAPGKTASRLKGATFDIAYVDGSATKGTVYADAVSLGTATVDRQGVEAASTINTAAEGEMVAVDGVMGFGFDNINSVVPTKQKTFFDNVKQSLTSPLFTTRLSATGISTWDFGYIDHSKYTGNITYVKVDPSAGFWTVNMGSFKIGSKSFQSKIGSGCLDTGTSLMYLPDSVPRAYYAQVKGAGYSQDEGGWIFPCASELPDLTLMIERHAVTVPGHVINFFKLSKKWCYGGLQTVDAADGGSILGDVFLRAAFVVWDKSQATPRVGFAHLA